MMLTRVAGASVINTEFLDLISSSYNADRTQMLTIKNLIRRRIITPTLVVVQVLAATVLLFAAPQYSDQRTSGYDPSQNPNQAEDGYYQGGPDQSTSTDAIRRRCSGPDAGPECAQLGSTGSTTTGVPQIFSNEDLFQMTGSSSKGNDSGSAPGASYRFSPQPPTEFQKFVFQSVGQRLGIFGANLFNNAPSTFAPVDRAPVPSDYVIGPGDQLIIRGWGQVDINVRATVDRSGNVYIPRVGEISLTGVKYSEVVPYLKGVISRSFRNFDLNVSMGQLRSIQVFVVGQARRPGTYTVSSLSTLVSTLFYSGGPLSTGSMRRIQLRRNDRVVVEFDLYDLLLRGDKSKDATLLPGDVIFIPPVGPQVAIVGSVNTPSIYELRANTKLEDAIQLAGGFTALTDNNKATVERVEQGDHQTFRKVEEFALNDQGLSKELRNGDIVRIAPLLPRFENTVTLRGNVSWPGRYPWHEGMRIRDLIPSREALLTRDFWQRQNPVYSATGEVRLSPVIPYTPKDGAGPTGNSNSQGATGVQGTDQHRSDQQSKTEYDWNSSTNAADAETTEAANRSSASADTDGSTSLSTGETKFRNYVKAVAPEINWDYAVIQRTNKDDLSTKLIPFNLGKAILDNDESQNLTLEPGDVVTIFSQKDIRVPLEKQAKFVLLEGEFVASGVYRVQPGETLKQLVMRVGGLTPNAYLFGSQFTRESTRERQQRELNRLVSELEVQVEQNASTAPGRVVSPEEAATLAPQLEGQRRLVEKLRQLQPSGRIVLELQGPNSTLADIPDMSLEDGDRFIVPYRPASVEVLGSVYNSNAFLWKPTKQMGDYLKDAGGPDRNADKKHIFVIRADGAVISSSSTGGFWGGGLGSFRLEPGDAVVVPQNLAKTSVLKGLKDWTQVFSNLALGAAAINVLR